MDVIKSLPNLQYTTKNRFVQVKNFNIIAYRCIFIDFYSAFCIRLLFIVYKTDFFEIYVTKLDKISILWYAEPSYLVYFLGAVFI